MQKKNIERIMLVSRSWLCHERSGVTFATDLHLRVLKKAGYEVCLIGADKRIVEERGDDPLFYVAARGSGAFYSWQTFNSEAARDAVIQFNPHLIIIEAWQTALTDGFIGIANEYSVPVIMISHGVAVHPFNSSLVELFRGFSWIIYKYITLPKLVKKLSVITSLDLDSKSNRFYDRDLARSLGIPTKLLVNAPINFSQSIKVRQDRLNQVLMVGYYSRIKNQLGLIKRIRDVDESVRFVFVGKREGAYYERCQILAKTHKILHRCDFIEDTECDLAQMYSDSFAVVCLSITEALPVTLIEAMASGTPFIATDVGAVSSLNSGQLIQESEVVEYIEKLLHDSPYWESLSAGGLLSYRENFTELMVSKQLQNVIDMLN